MKTKNATKSLLAMSCLVGLFGCVENQPLLIHAARVFDGEKMQQDVSVLIQDGKVVSVDKLSAFSDRNAKLIELGDATLTPGFIELHSHLDFHQIPEEEVLRHGITTIRNVGGVEHFPTGGDGQLRNLTSGRILTVPNGYPINAHGEKGIAIPLKNEQQARQAVRDLIADGAVIIKIALETGGEAGAPWASESGHHHGHAQPATTKKNEKSAAWSMLSQSMANAIVDEAHKLGRKVTAHVGEVTGVKIANLAGVDEWAHFPCADIPAPNLQQAVKQGVKIVSTIDTLSKCAGIANNVHKWTAMGGEVLYGAEIAHPDIPWGIDAQELMYLSHYAKMKPIDLLHTATAKAGEYLEIPLLGTLKVGAPADLIAFKGDVLTNLKKLEYPDLVISGGVVVKNNFE